MAHGGPAGSRPRERRLTVTQSTTKAPETTIGVDLGDRFSRYCVLDAAGEVIEEGRVATTEVGLKNRFEGAPPARMAIEVGTHSPWVSRRLSSWGHEVLVANPRRLPLITQNDKKTDRVDAEFLARLARVDAKLLAPIEHRSKEVQADLAVLRARDSLVVARTRLVNHVRGAVKSFGERVPKCDAGSFHRKATEHVPVELNPALERVLDVVEGLTKVIREYDRAIEKMARERYPVTERLQQVPGVGPLTSTGFVLTIGNPHRFQKSRQVGSYFGLRPRLKESGEQDPQLRISKAGDRYMRRLLVGSAQYLLGPFGPETDLRTWGLKLAERGGKNAKKRAVVAVARKLAVLLHRLWVSGANYEPRRASARLRRRETPSVAGSARG